MISTNTQSAYHDFASLSQLRGQASLQPDAASHEVAKQFESIFVSFVLKAMRDTVPEDSLFGSDAMKSYQQMFDSQLAVSLADQGGLGLAPLIEKQIAVMNFAGSEGEGSPGTTDTL